MMGAIKYTIHFFLEIGTQILFLTIMKKIFFGEIYNYYLTKIYEPYVKTINLLNNMKTRKLTAWIALCHIIMIACRKSHMLVAFSLQFDHETISYCEVNLLPKKR